MFQEIKASLEQLYLEDQRPWLVGFSGDVGPSSARPGSKALRPYNDAVLTIPGDHLCRPVYHLLSAAFAIPFTVYRLLSTVFPIPAIAEMIEGTLDRMRKCSQQHGLNIEANLLKPMYEESFWVNIIGRGYPPPNRTFRWCTQRMKIDPVNDFVNRRVAIRCSGDLRSPTGGRRPPLQTAARRAESSTRAQTMAGRQARNGLNRHPDLPRVWVSNPIQFPSTEEVWAYLLQNPNPWGGDNRPLTDTPWRAPTPAPRTASAPSKSTPARPVAATAASAVGRARWLIGTKPSRDCWPHIL